MTAPTTFRVSVSKPNTQLASSAGPLDGLAEGPYRHKISLCHARLQPGILRIGRSTGRAQENPNAGTINSLLTIKRDDSNFLSGAATTDVMAPLPRETGIEGCEGTEKSGGDAAFFHF
jgi:hypothetical protein